MDKTDKLIEAVEHPERFSESELQTLLSDPEARDLYRLMCAARADSYIRDLDDSSDETERQWSAFKSTRRRKPFMAWLRSRRAAVVAALAIASCSIIMVGVSLSNKMRNDRPMDTESSASMEAISENATSEAPALTDTVIVFEDEKLDRILARTAPYYNVRVDLKSRASKEIRLFLKWDSTTPLPELIDHLNSFDRINLFLKDDTITDY